MSFSVRKVINPELTAIFLKGKFRSLTFRYYFRGWMFQNPQVVINHKTSLLQAAVRFELSLGNHFKVVCWSLYPEKPTRV